jgi:predicted deacylase
MGRTERVTGKTMASIVQAVQAPPGHYLVETPVTTLASGQPLNLVTHVLRGASPGPVVGILSGLHGDEFSTTEVILSLHERIVIDNLAGTLLLVPMANALSFEAGTRSTPLDMSNLNRVFPGNPRGTVSEMLANTLCEAFLAPCDVLFDLHSEPDAMAIRCFYAAFPNDDYGRRTLDLAKASGCPIIYVTSAQSGTLAGVARDRGVLAVVPETGGPLPGAAGLLEEAQDEILNMLRWLRVLPGAPLSDTNPVIVDTVAHVRAPAGGLFRPIVGFDIVGRSVRGSSPLGTVISPYTGETLATIEAPFAESWMMMVRGRVSRVHPGDPLYIIGREMGVS